jgi:hypothetical protein
MSAYQRAIAEVVSDIEPRIVEAYMRLTYRTLDALSKADFDAAAKRARNEAIADGLEFADETAKSMGL